MQKLLARIAIGFATAGTCLASAVDDPVTFMADVAKTYQSASFSGEYIMTKDANSEKYRVARWINDGQLFERLDIARADGTHTVLRSNNQLINIYPEKTLFRMPSHHQVRHLDQLQSSFEDIASFYELSPIPSASVRIAGRSVEGVQFSPLDNHRYVYSIWVDSVTRLPLKFEYSWEGGVLESTEFVELIERPSLNSTFFEIPPGLAETAAPDTKLQDVPNWVAAWLPPGFKQLSDGDTPRAPDDPSRAKQKHSVPRRMYGDGIATISVFVQPLLSGDSAVAKGVFRSGALSMISSPRENSGGVWEVAVLGEVPPLTLKMVAMHVEFSAEPAHAK